MNVETVYLLLARMVLKEGEPAHKSILPIHIVVAKYDLVVVVDKCIDVFTLPLKGRLFIESQGYKKGVGSRVADEFFKVLRFYFMREINHCIRQTAK